MGPMNRHLTALTALACCLLSCQPGFAQKLVDPASVAPEFREAAEKRRAEQIRQRECAHKANVEKIMPRERTAFLNNCLEEAAAK